MMMRNQMLQIITTTFFIYQLDSNAGRLGMEPWILLFCALLKWGKRKDNSKEN
jgi:hypothetical protein